ncbi:mitogen-activated protein kinase kinase kinase 1-like [Gastrolobium bilobum]|uniref:mitogen-activated protein kinase kinase kinase 1-like n=1 Tax=Gastrolobium bilobum TaxID=150636 RepID=UPI002AB29EC1|nr:mitogen-activated protein kinase kinase kinase 1-like [Gastrolobium bilobum]
MESKWKMKKQPRRLERLNAKKNIDYEPPGCSSLDLELQTSLRVTGIDGEFDRICQSLGLSGPQDFEIPTADWEARKARFCDNRAKEERVSAKLATGVVSNCDAELKNDTFDVEDLRVEVLGCDNGDGVGGGGIKGVRPPILTPPPVILKPIVDGVSSTWDLMRSFAPQDVGVVDSPSSSGEHDGRGIVGRLRLGERSVLFSDSSSCTTSHDDDSDVGGERGCSLSCSGSGGVHELVHYVSSNEWFRRTFSSWQKGDVLGKGSFGTVYEGFTEAGFFFAVKEVSLLDEGSHGKQSILQLQQEISLLSQFEHENIVQYYGSDKDKSTLFIFLQLVSKGSLASLYQKYRLNDSQVSAYTRQILCGLKYLHDRKVVHRDIKCANILVDVNGLVKLADFGLAKATKLNDVKSSKGSPYWMAPEVVNLRNQGYGLAADIWSLGCTVLEMLTRQPPYSDLEGMQALFQIGRGETPPIPESLSKDARDFILTCLQVNPNKRPTAAQLLDHPFLRRPFPPPLSPASPHVNIFRF